MTMTKVNSEMLIENNSINNLKLSSQQMAVYFVMSFRKLCLATVSLPLVALCFCFITAYIFQYDDVHETHCRVYNIIPSISAITGVTPQIYLWRVCVALHIGPRIIIASVYHSYYASLLRVNKDSESSLSTRFWLTLTYWLNVIEIAALCGVTYISNRENYPIHEKIFITFMISSLTHMLANIKVIRIAQSMGAKEKSQGQPLAQSLFIKQTLFAISLLSTVGLVGFFLKHRLLCHDMAFSWFALCEYIIAISNMAFHVIVVFDFPTENLIVADAIPLTSPAYNKKSD